MEKLRTCCLQWRGKWRTRLTKWMRRLRGQNDGRQRSFAATNSIRSPSPLLYSYAENDNTDGSHPGQGEETSYSNTVPASSSATKEALSISAEEVAAGEDQTLPHFHGDRQASDFSGYVTSGNTALSDHPAETISASQPIGSFSLSPSHPTTTGDSAYGMAIPSPRSRGDSGYGSANPSLLPTDDGSTTLNHRTIGYGVSIGDDVSATPSRRSTSDSSYHSFISSRLPTGDDGYVSATPSRRPTGDVGDVSATPSRRSTSDSSYHSCISSRLPTGDDGYVSATPSRRPTGDSHRSDSPDNSMEKHSHSALLKPKSRDSGSSRPLSVPVHGSDPNELPYSFNDNNCAIAESHIKQSPQTWVPVMEQIGEAFPTVPEIHIVSPNNKPILESFGYIEECTSQNDDMIPTSNHTDVTSKGRKVTHEANEFSLEIPVGAIPEGEILAVDLGVALSGPFKFPKGLRPVSPVFLICTKKESQFSIPVLVTIPHFLNLKNDDDITSLGLTFLKADHNKNSEGLYEFHKADGQMIFEPHKRFGVLHTTHFCSLCITCIDNLQSLEKTAFCITAVLPNTAIPVGEKAYGYFFLTFNLGTCLRRLDEIIKRMNLVGYDVKSDAFEFRATNSSEEPALEMTITQPEHGRIGENGSKTVQRKDIDFFIRESDKKKLLAEIMIKENAGLYPPRISVFFASTPANTTLSGGRIEFKGATKSLSYDIFLAPDAEDRVQKKPSELGRVIQNRTLTIDDLFEVKTNVIDVVGRWRDIGLALGIRDPALDAIQIESQPDIEECLRCMLKLWLNQSYDTQRYGMPTWQRLSEAVGHRCGGRNAALAHELHDTWEAMDTT